MNHIGLIQSQRLRTMFLIGLVSTGMWACSNDDSGSPGNGTVGGMMGGPGGNPSADGGAQADGGIENGCTGNADCPPGRLCDTASNQCRLGCRVDDDCGPDGRCDEAGLCGVAESCMSDDDCQADVETCDCRSRCVQINARRCRSNLSCETTDYCDPCSGQCRPRGEQCGECRSDDECDPRAICVRASLSGQDIGQPGYCARQCQGTCDVIGPGYACEEARPGVMACVPSAGLCEAVEQCQTDAECPPDRFCGERGTCQPGCDSDISCPGELLCQGLRCAPPCSADNPCDAGQMCEADGHCRVPGGCVTSADCPEMETFCDREQLLCVPGCEVDNDCLDATMECLGGQCRPRGCSGNYQCAFGQVCQQDTNMCIDAPGRHCEAGCDPQADGPCGDAGSRCLSLQDDDGNALGDFCFEACQPEPNECPKGYSCVELMDDMGAAMGNLCVRDCTVQVGN